MMKKPNVPKHVFLFFMIFLLSIISVSSQDYDIDTEVLIFNDSFDYSDVFTNHGWLYASPPDEVVPITSPFSTNAFGRDSTETNKQREIRRSITLYNTSKFILSFNLSVQENTFDSQQLPAFINIGNDGGIRYQLRVGTNGGMSMEGLGVTGGDDCTLSNALTIPFETSVYLVIDFDNMIYSIYLDGEETNCINMVLQSNNDYYVEDISFFTFAGSGGASPKLEAYFDDIKFINGSIQQASAVSCPVPNVFCDTFNRETSYFDFGWFPYNSQFTIDETFVPIDNQMQLNGTESSRIMFHEIFRYGVNYPISASSTITGSPYVPVMSSQFELSLLQDFTPADVEVLDSCLHHSARSGVGHVIYNTAYCRNGSVYARDSVTDTDSYTELCVDCVNETINNKTYLIKISSFFNSSAHPEITQFTTNFDDNVKVSIGCLDCDDTSILTYEIGDFVDDRAFDSRNLQFDNTGNGLWTIDNYFVYSGVSTESDTLRQFYEPIFQANLENVSTLTTESDDLSETVKNLWWTFGLRTQASRTMFGLFLIMAIDLFLLVAMINFSKINPSALLYTDLILVLLGAMAGLFPVWLVIVIGIIGGGIALFISSKGVSNGG